MKEIDKRIFYGILMIAIFFLIVFSTLDYEPIHNFLDSIGITSFLVVTSLIVGAGTHAFMSEKIEKKDQLIKNNLKLFLKFLNDDERKVVEKLVENYGKALQAEITRLPGMSKLKSHRAVKKLLLRGVIEVENLGKTNVIKLNKEIGNIFNE